MKTVSKTPLTTIIFPTTVIAININNAEIHHNLHDTIRRARHVKPTQQYFRKKYSWHLQVFKLIDWIIHRTLLVSTQHYKLFNLKFIHNWLPVSSHAAMTPSRPQCLGCHQLIECQSHWYQCKEDQRNWDSNYQQSVTFLQSIGLHS
jgi:hypothetical protein